MTQLEESCLIKAQTLLDKGYVSGIDVFQLADTLIALEKEKADKNAKSDQTIDFNDEIISIEECGELETTDISVSGDNLFYCNGILTKNSFGLPATSDLMIALISSEQLEGMNQIMVKQLKNRYNDTNQNKRFVLGIDRSKMRLYDVSAATANLVVDSPGHSTEPQTPFAANIRKNFNGLKV